MDYNELHEANRQYVQAVLDECRLLHRPEHIIDTLTALCVGHETRLYTGDEEYLVHDDQWLERGPGVTVADLGDEYSMAAIEQCVLENRKALLALHHDLMAVHEGGGEGDGGAANEFIYKPATAASERMRAPETVSEVPPDPEADPQPPATVEAPRQPRKRLRAMRQRMDAQGVPPERPVVDETPETNRATQKAGPQPREGQRPRDASRTSETRRNVEQAPQKQKQSASEPLSEEKLEERYRRFPELRPDGTTEDVQAEDDGEFEL